jgi:hypothetical protein
MCMADASNSWVSVLKPRADMRSDMDFQCKTSITTLLLYSNKYFSNNFWNFMKFLKKIEIFEILKKKIWNFWNLMTFFESFEILWYQGRYGKCHVIIYKYSGVVRSILCSTPLKQMYFDISQWAGRHPVRNCSETREWIKTKFSEILFFLN